MCPLPDQVGVDGRLVNLGVERLEDLAKNLLWWTLCSRLRDCRRRENFAEYAVNVSFGEERGQESLKDCCFVLLLVSEVLAGSFRKFCCRVRLHGRYGRRETKRVHLRKIRGQTPEQQGTYTSCCSFAKDAHYDGRRRGPRCSLIRGVHFRQHRLGFIYDYGKDTAEEERDSP